MGESVNLTWPCHMRTLVEGMWSLFQDRYHTDFQLAIEQSGTDTSNYSHRAQPPPHNVNVHRLILAVFCPNLIKNYQGNQFYLHTIGVIDQQDLNCLVELIYRGKVTVAEDRLDKLKVGAEILGIKTIVDLVDKYFIGKALKEKEVGLKNSRGARKRKSKPFKISKRMSRRVNNNNSHAKVSSNDTKMTEKPAVLEDVKPYVTGFCVPDAVTEEEDRSEAEQDDNCSEIESDSSDYNPHLKKSEMVGANKRKKGNNLWKKTTLSAALERLRPRRGYGFNKRKRKRKETQGESQPPVAFDDARKQFVCKFCDKGFSTKDRHARHVRCHENPDNLQKCLHCDYKTVEKYVLVQHLASKHHVDRDGNQLTRDIKCTDCAFTCVSNFQLKNHKLQKHSNKQFKCDECGHLFGKKALRDRHVLAKHRNERPHLCETCGHRAKTLNAFKSHLELHSGKKFVCDICGLALTLSCSLKRHMKLHMSNERPFPCHLCSFATRKRYNLRVHLRNVHKLEMDSMGNVTSKHELMVSNTLVSTGALPSSLLSGDGHHNHHHHPHHQTLESALCIPELESMQHLDGGRHHS